MEGSLELIVPIVDLIPLTSYFYYSNNENVVLFIGLLSAYDLSQTVPEPTRITNFSCTLLEVIAVSGVNYVINSIADHIHKVSDFSLVLYQVYLEVYSFKSKVYTNRYFRNFIYDHFHRHF